jgi:hypothetical protein
MMQPPVWLLGALAGHARGKLLIEAIDASVAHVLPPEYGLCMAFGSEFQEHDEESQREWVRWAEPAGRTLLLMPPFKMVETTIPVPWRIYRPQRVEAEADRLAKLLASEVRYELTGTVQIATDIGGQWKGGGINTGYYRKHPHSGLFALTCLPLWSLMVLDHRELLQNWSRALHDLAGDPTLQHGADEQSHAFRPSKDHFAMLLHLCERVFDSTDEAVAALADSPVLTMPAVAARQCLQQLKEAELAVDGKLTEAGRAMLFDSPYAAYAEAMEASRT